MIVKRGEKMGMDFQVLLPSAAASAAAECCCSTVLGWAWKRSCTWTERCCRQPGSTWTASKPQRPARCPQAEIDALRSVDWDEEVEAARDPTVKVSAPWARGALRAGMQMKSWMHRRPYMSADVWAQTMWLGVPHAGHTVLIASHPTALTSRPVGSPAHPVPASALPLLLPAPSTPPTTPSPSTPTPRATWPWSRRWR